MSKTPKIIVWVHQYNGTLTGQTRGYRHCCACGHMRGRQRLKWRAARGHWLGQRLRCVAAQMQRLGRLGRHAAGDRRLGRQLSVAAQPTATAA